MSRVITVALTGGIGSGKSLAGRFFEELGAFVIDSDQMAREVIERGTPGFDDVVTLFGDGVLKDGSIDRKALGEIVFKSDEARKKLENIIHPAIRKRFESLVKSAPEGSVVINQIPLLVETDGASRFDVVVTVNSDVEIRKERLLKRGLTLSEIEGRLKAQVSDDARSVIAHHVINNNGSEDNLLRQVEEIYEKLKNQT